MDGPTVKAVWPTELGLASSQGVYIAESMIWGNVAAGVYIMHVCISNHTTQRVRAPCISPLRTNQTTTYRNRNAPRVLTLNLLSAARHRLHLSAYQPKNLHRGT